MATMMKLVVSFLALAVAASSWPRCASAGGGVKSLEDFCKSNTDPKYCVTLLKPITTPSEMRKSTAYLADARGKVLEIATAASDFLTDHDNDVARTDISASRICDNKLRNTLDLINMNDFDTAAMELDACSTALNSATGVMKDAKVKVDEALRATRVLNDLYIHR